MYLKQWIVRFPVFYGYFGTLCFNWDFLIFQPSVIIPRIPDNRELTEVVSSCSNFTQARLTSCLWMNIWQETSARRECVCRHAVNTGGGAAHHRLYLATAPVPASSRASWPGSADLPTTRGPCGVVGGAAAQVSATASAQHGQSPAHCWRTFQVSEAYCGVSSCLYQRLSNCDTCTN